MWWLWYVVPVAAGLLWVLTSRLDARALQEIEAWREALGDRRLPKETPSKKKKTAYREGAEGEAAKKKKKKKDGRPKRLAKVVPEIAAALPFVGEGRPLGDYELVPNVAYVSFMMADLGGSSDHQTVFVRLAESAPSFTARPWAFFKDKPLPNTAIEFRKDPEFAAAYLVEGDATQAKAIGKWLTRSLRELIVESEEVWLRAAGKTLSITIYGAVRKDKIEKLLEVADLFVAEYGAEGGPSLFGEDEEERAARLAERDAEAEGEDESAANEAEDDADEDDDADDDDSDSKKG